MNKFLHLIFLPLFFASCNFEKGSQISELTECDTITQITYSNFIEPLMDKNCSRCHNARSGNLILCSYPELSPIIESGKFLGALYHAHGFKPMPLDSVKLDSCTLKKIKLWVENGAPE
jgi:hypothetical protein